MSVHANEQWRMSSIIGPIWSSGLETDPQVPPAAPGDAQPAAAAPAATPAPESYEARDASGKKIPLSPEQQIRFNEIYAERGRFQREAEAGKRTAAQLEAKTQQLEDELYRLQQTSRTAPPASQPPPKPGERSMPPELQALFDHPEWGPVFRAQQKIIEWHLQPVSETTKRLQEERELAGLESQHAQKQEAAVKVLVQIQDRIVGELKVKDSYSDHQVKRLSDWAVNEVAVQAEKEHWEELPVERQQQRFELAFRQRMQEQLAMWPAGKKPAAISPEELENALPAGEIVPGSTGAKAPDPIMEALYKGEIGAGEAARQKTDEVLKELRRKKRGG